MLELLAVILLIVVLFGHPGWRYSRWGYRPYGSGIGLLIFVLLLLLLLGR